MLDITLQLRRYAGGVCLSTQVELDAANEIERLREALESALEENTDLIRALERMFSNDTESLREAKQIGRGALQRAGGKQ